MLGLSFQSSQPALVLARVRWVHTNLQSMHSSGRLWTYLCTGVAVARQSLLGPQRVHRVLRAQQGPDAGLQVFYAPLVLGGRVYL